MRWQFIIICRRIFYQMAVMKKRIIQKGSQLPTNCKQLKMKAADKKRRLTDFADTELQQTYLC
jgi:hypothetical protein